METPQERNAEVAVVAAGGRPAYEAEAACIDAEAMTSKKAGLGAGLLFKAITRPRVIALALRVRGWRDVLAAFVSTDPRAVTTIVRDVQSKLPPTPENLRSWYRGVQFLPSADDRFYKVRVPTGEEFLIRMSRGWQDLGTVYEVFVVGIYADHPPVDGKTVLDVGANIGDTAVYFAKRGARVIAYEPDPEMCELARRNVAGNDLHADIRDAGVGATTETLRLSASPDGADALSATLFPGHASVDPLRARSHPIRVVAFAEVLTELGSVDLVKIDCQGCEYPAFASLTKADMRRIKHVVMEYHGESGALEDKLRACGFSVRLKGTMYMHADRVDEP
jgi:FkbM family methyltransferase